MKPTRMAVALVAGLALMLAVPGCTRDSVQQAQETYTIGGAISGLEGSGLALGTAGEPDLAVTAGATGFAFASKVPAGTAYAVMVVQQPTNPSQRCVVTNGTGSVRGADVTSILVNCSASPPRLLGVRVRGLEGHGLVLATPGQLDAAVEPGRSAFTFRDSLPMGTAYAISVVSQPDGQNCVVAHGEGVVGGAELFDAIVRCFAPSGRKALAVAGGWDSSFVITEDGELWAWGANSSGQLGDGTREDRSSPVLVGSGFASVVPNRYRYWGAARTLALKEDGTLWAWGDWGELLGHVQGEPALSPELVGPDYVSVAMSESHALAVKADGTLWAWGSDNYYGQLGTGTLYDWKAEPVPVLIGSGFRAVAAAGATSHATKTDGTLWAWGENYSGQIGDGSREHRPLPVLVTSGVEAVTAYRDLAFAVKSDGSLWAWGDYGSSSTERISPVRIGEGFVSVAFPFGLMSDGTLWEWNDGAFGETALIGGGFRSISAGGPYLAAKLDGTLWAWGRDASAQPSLSGHLSPVQLGAGFAAISAGEWSVIALKTDGSAWQWGWGCQGDAYQPVRFGDGFTSAVGGVFALRSDGTIWSREYWHSVVEQLPFGDGFFTLANSREPRLALKTDRTLWGWGRNDYGQVWKGLAPHIDSPVLVGREVVSVAVGNWHSLAVKTDGTLWEWGQNGSDFLGYGGPGMPEVPALVGDGFVSVVASSDHSLAIKADGTLWAWGSNADGVLGDGTTAARPLPVQVATGKVEGFTSVQAASAHTVAIDTAGSLWAWGRNEAGALGDGTMVDRLSPVEIGNGFAQASAADVRFRGDMCMSDSFSYTLAVKPDGTLWGWGSNEYGFLGLPTSAARPQQVPF